MKKRLCLILFILSSCVCVSQAKFFIGIDAGYSIDRVDIEKEVKHDYQGSTSITIPGSYTKNAYKGNGYLFNINLGTQHYFDNNELVGFRWLLIAGYGRTTLINQSNKSIKYPSSIGNLNLGADILLDILKFSKNNSLGIFGGIEAGGVFTLSDEFKDGDIRTPVLFSGFLSFSARAGLSLFLDKHHRIEFLAKIPVYTAMSVRDEVNSYFYKTYPTHVGL